MLSELKNKVQDQLEPESRIFTSLYFDLFVWYGDDKQISGFQLCYDKPGDQHAFTWRKELGFSHRRVDDGGRARRGATEFLVPDGYFPAINVIPIFEKESAEMDPEIVILIKSKIDDYLDSSS